MQSNEWSKSANVTFDRAVGWRCERIGSLSKSSCFAARIAKWILQLWHPPAVCQANGSEADQPTLPLALPGSAVHLVTDDASLTLLEGVLRERRGGTWCNFFFHGPFEIYMSWVRNEVSSDLGRLVAGHVFEATGCQAPQMSSRKATMMLQSHLCSPFLEAWHKNLWTKTMVKAFSRSFLWHGLAVTQMYCYGTKRWHSDWGLDAEWQPNTSQGVALFQMAFRRSVLLGLWHMTVNMLKQWQDEVQKTKSVHSWLAPLQLAGVSYKTSKLHQHSNRRCVAVNTAQVVLTCTCLSSPFVVFHECMAAQVLVGHGGFARVRVATTRGTTATFCFGGRASLQGEGYLNTKNWGVPNWSPNASFFFEK